MRHIVLTRFNAWNHTEESYPTNSEKIWINYRLVLFKKFTLPSLLNQTDQNFEWLFFISHKTSNYFKTKIKEISDRYKVIEVTQKHSNWRDSINEYFSTIVNHNDEVLISEIDSDDALHKDYFKIIKENVDKKRKDCFIHFPDGYFSYKGIYFKKTYYYNNFINTYYPTNGKYIIDNHYLDIQRGDTIYIPNKYVWLLNFHDLNEESTLKRLEISPKTVIQNKVEFNLDDFWSKDLK